MKIFKNKMNYDSIKKIKNDFKFNIKKLMENVYVIKNYKYFEFSNK